MISSQRGANYALISHLVEEELLQETDIPWQPLEKKLGVASLHAVPLCRVRVPIELLRTKNAVGLILIPGIYLLVLERYVGMFHL